VGRAEPQPSIVTFILLMPKDKIFHVENNIIQLKISSK